MHKTDLPVLTQLRSDPILSTVIDAHTLPELRPLESISLFAEVVSSIISQQLSVKAANVIEARFLKLLPNGKATPEAVLVLDSEEIRQCGVSYAKIRYIKSAADAALSGEVDFDALPDKSDEEVIAELIKIHGVGKWTAEMLLIFSLGRPDVFSLGDLGLRTAVSRLYGVDREDLATIQAIASRWAPNRSLASRYLWKSLDNTPA